MGDPTTFDVADTEHELQDQTLIRADARRGLSEAIFRALPAVEYQVLLLLDLASECEAAQTMGVSLKMLRDLRDSAYAKLSAMPELRDLLHTICQDQTQRQMGQSRAKEGAE